MAHNFDLAQVEIARLKGQIHDLEIQHHLPPHQIRGRSAAPSPAGIDQKGQIPWHPPGRQPSPNVRKAGIPAAILVR